MGLYLVSADLDDLAEEVQVQLESQGFRTRKRRSSSAATLLAQRTSEHVLTEVEASIRLEAVEGGVLLRDDFKPGLVRRVAMLVPLSWLATMLVLVAWFLDEFASALSNAMGYCAAYYLLKPPPLAV